MFHFPLSTRERLWLLALRLVWNFRERRADTTRRIDALWRGTGQAPVAGAVFGMLSALERAGAGHLYIEGYDQTGITGDERDLLAALRACYLDEVLDAEQALSALLPPGESAAVIEAMFEITQPSRPHRIAPSVVTTDAPLRASLVH